MALSDTAGSTFKLPLGPVHVALEEPVYFHLEIDGETITKATLQSGHVHRGMENLAQKRNLIMDQTLTERVCSLCSNSHSFTYAMVVENALRMNIPERAKYLRVMTEEIKRMARIRKITVYDGNEYRAEARAYNASQKRKKKKKKK